MNKTALLLALGIAVTYYTASIYYYNYSVPIVSLPLIGTILDIKPFQVLAPFNVFVGLLLAFFVSRIFKKKGRGN